MCTRGRSEMVTAVPFGCGAGRRPGRLGSGPSVLGRASRDLAAARRTPHWTVVLHRPGTPSYSAVLLHRPTPPGTDTAVLHGRATRRWSRRSAGLCPPPGTAFGR